MNDLNMAPVYYADAEVDDTDTDTRADHLEAEAVLDRADGNSCVVCLCCAMQACYLRRPRAFVHRYVIGYSF